MSRFSLCISASIVLTSGCAMMSPVQVGQTAGTIAGAAAVPGIGAPLGALVGMLAGMLVQGQVDQVTEQRERKELAEQLQDEPITASAQLASTATAPVGGHPTRVWVDETVENGRILAGRFETRHLQ